MKENRGLILKHQKSNIILIIGIVLSAVIAGFSGREDILKDILIWFSCMAVYTLGAIDAFLTVDEKEENNKGSK